MAKSAGTLVVEAAKTRANDGDSPITLLSTGIRAKMLPVGASLVDDMVGQVKNPPIPRVMNEEKGRTEENPLDPEYLIACSEATAKRASAAMNAIILFGLELVDGLPEDITWLKKLKFLEKHNDIKLLEGFDLDDDFDLKFLYKKYVATGTRDLIKLGMMAGLSKEAVETAAQSFQD